MISVIVPVYNVEPYLRKCLDSIVGQTYRDLEILVIDDGSTDGSGEICDEYKKDERVKVFHTQNRGLSCARNLGLDEAQGEWIGFVDSDDWIEPDMYEVLLSRAEETGADVVECGYFNEKTNRVVEKEKQDIIIPSDYTITALLTGELVSAIWCKLWRSKCSINIHFPEGRVFEDVATTYRVFADMGQVATIAEAKYHYVQRNDSLSKMINMSNLAGCWISHYERYKFLDRCRMHPEMKHELRFCAMAAARTWAHYFDCNAKDRENCWNEIYEMHRFVKQIIPITGYSSWNMHLRIGVFFPHFNNSVSFSVAWIIYRFDGIFCALLSKNAVMQS